NERGHAERHRTVVVFVAGVVDAPSVAGLFGLQLDDLSEQSAVGIDLQLRSRDEIQEVRAKARDRGGREPKLLDPTVESLDRRRHLPRVAHDAMDPEAVRRAAYGSLDLYNLDRFAARTLPNLHVVEDEVTALLVHDGERGAILLQAQVHRNDVIE